MCSGSADGPVAAFQHHRGITHTLVAAPVIALVTLAVIWLWSIAALVFVVLYWSLRNAEKGHAVELVENSGVVADSITKIDAEPYPFNPFAWHVVAETRIMRRYGGSSYAARRCADGGYHL